MQWVAQPPWPASLTWISLPKGQPQTVRLFTAHSLPIIRHTKINSQVNPYDPQWEPYLEQRQGLKMAASLQGRRTLLYLWQRQDGRCPHCGEAIRPYTNIDSAGELSQAPYGNHPGTQPRTLGVR
jgi:hypothetical protein